ncbi:TonB-dependent receptor [Tannerella sp.]|uniref:TonB-dependent receptor n=1 Tax=Tannerella sp. TaxID=2382127 RepID=UPI003FA2A732
MDDSMKKALGECVVFRKLPRLFRGMSLLLCLLAISLPKLQADPQKQKISMDMSDVTIEEVLQSIEEKSDYYFLYNSRLINVERKVNVRAKNKPVAAILEDLFASGDVDYEVKGTQIVLSPMSMRASARSGAKEIQQQKTVSGRIVDEQGEPVIGANVVEKGTTNGTVTDADGRFSLSVAPNGVLHISYIGYLDEEVQVSGKTSVNITLREDTQALEEVVVIGYGTVRKKDLSGAVSNVKFTETPIATLPNPNAFAALSSKVAGLHYLPTKSSSGNNLSTMSLRGRNSIPEASSDDKQGVNAPLIIVDGSIFYGSISEIQNSDIQNIDVMKDASSAAIYGSRAANGVIIITTKNGVSEKPVVNFNASYKWNSWARKPNLQTDKDKFLEHRHLAKIAGGSLAEGTPVDPAADLTAEELEVYNAGGWIDWLDEVSQKAPSQTYGVNVSGKSKMISYYASTGYDRTKGVLKGDDYEKYTVMVKMDSKINSWLKVGLKGSYLGAKGWGAKPSMQAATWMSPFAYRNVRFDGYTHWIEEYPTGADGQINPLWGRENASYLWTDTKTVDYNVGGIAYAQIDFPFLKGLTYKFTLNAQRNTSQTDLINNSQLWVDTRTLADLKNPYSKIGNVTGYVRDYHVSNWNADNLLTYTTDIGKHHVDALLGYTREAYNSEHIRIDFKGFDIPAATTLGTYGLDLSNADNLLAARQRMSTQSVAYLARLNYHFANRYYLTGNFRRDGFSAFAEGHKWGNFFGVSGAWVISSENFMERTKDWLDFMKLRLSWGQNGSRGGIGAYSTIAAMNKTYTWFGDKNAYALYVKSLTNRNLTWATTSKWNVGLDFAFINNRINGSLDFYTSATTDMVLNRSIPYVAGFPKVDANAGKVTNKGVELSLNTVNVQGDGNQTLRWESNLIFDLNRNKIKKLFDDNNNDDYSSVTTYGYDSYYALMVGYSITSAYDYKKLGIFQSQEEIDNYRSADGKLIQPNAKPGDLKFLDYNQDGKINTNDRHWIGDMDPLFTVNFGNTLSWKNLSLYFSFRWMQGSDTHFLGYDPNGFQIDASNNQLNIEPWTKDNHTDKYPRYGYNNSLNYNFWNSRTFLKLKDLSLAYNVDKALLEKAKIQALQLYVASTDLFTITGWSGLDPEDGGTTAANMSSTRYGMTPTYKTVSLGVNITF